MPDKKKILLISANDSHFSVLDLLYEQLSLENEYIVKKLLFPNLTFDQRIQIEEHDLSIVTSWNIGEWFKIRNKSFLIPHGIGTEDVSSAGDFEKVLLSGSYFSKGLSNEKLVGFTKSDILFGKNRDKIIQETREKYGLDKLPFEQTILFNGAWVEEQHLWETYLPKLLILSKKEKFNIIIKPRIEITYQQMLGNRKIENVLSSYQNVKCLICNNWTLFPFVNISISGDSSTVREFYATKKPSFCLEAIPHRYPEAFSLNVNDFEEILTKALKDSEPWTQNDDVVSRYFYKIDGKVNERIIEEIRKFIVN